MPSAHPWLAATPHETTPEHIEELARLAEECRPEHRFLTGLSSTNGRWVPRSSWTAFGHGLADTGGKIGTPPRPQEMDGTRGCLAGAPTMGSSIFARQATVDLSGKDEHSTKRSKRKREPSQGDEPMNRARERTERMWHPLPPC